MNFVKNHKINPIVKVAVISVALFSSSNILAQDAQASTGWSGLISIGLTGSDGNNKTNDFDASLNLTHNADFTPANPFRNTITVNYKFADLEQQDGEKIDTKDQQAVIYNLDYALDDKSFLRGLLSYYSDEIFGIDTFYAAGLGYQVTVYASDRHKLQVHAGLVQFDIDYTTEEDIKDTGGVVGFDYTGNLIDNISMQLKAETQETRDLVYRTALAALNFKLTEHTSIALTHNLTYFSDLPDDKDKTDTVTALNLNYTF